MPNYSISAPASKPLATNRDRSFQNNSLLHLKWTRLATIIPTSPRGTMTALFGDNYPVRFDDNYLDRLTDTKDNGEFHIYGELTLAWKTYHSTSREFIYEQTSTRTKPANRSSAGDYF